jgi:hypothetical protein
VYGNGGASGFDSPVKIAFAELRSGILSRVDGHNAFAEQVGDQDIAGDTDEFGAMKDRLEAFLSFMVS